VCRGVQRHSPQFNLLVELISESSVDWQGSFAETQGSFADVLGSFANVYGSCAHGCYGTCPNSTCSLRWYPTLLRIHRALLQMYGVLLRMHTARVWMSLMALVRIQVARWDDTQLFGGYIGLFCPYIGLFCPYIGLFCGCIGLFCEFKMLVELIHDSLVDTKDSFVWAQLFFLTDVSYRVCFNQLRTTYSLNWYTETHISFAETSGSLAD